LLSPTFLDEAEDYDVTKSLVSASGPPPGLGPIPPQSAPRRPPGLPSPEKIPPTPVNSIAQSLGSSDDVPKELLMKDISPTKTPNNSVSQIAETEDLPVRGPPKTPQNSMAQIPETDVIHTAPPPQPPSQPPSQQQQQQQQRVPLLAMPHGPPQMPFPPHPPGMGLPPGIPMAQPMPIAPIIAQPILPPTPQQPQRKPDAPWQQQMPPPQVAQPMMRPPRLYCNVHFGAPPIPATALESKMMKSRDVAYIVHSIMKPILMMGESPGDYHIQLLERQSNSRVRAQKSSVKKLDKEMRSRQSQSMSHMKEKSTLGHLAKANVARPRALIATPKRLATNDSDDAEQKQRAQLWKARVYVDQGYTAMHALVILWKNAAPGTVPPRVQTQLLRLLKCLGMSRVTNEEGEVMYEMDVDKAMTSILKLSKGRTFVARVLEQALLPPNAVQVMLPPTMSAALKPLATTNVEDDHRLFSSFGRVIATLPTFSAETMVKAVDAVQTKEALETPARMECVHALLRRGSHMSASPEATDEFKEDWKSAEAKFMELLG